MSKIKKIARVENIPAKRVGNFEIKKEKLEKEIYPNGFFSRSMKKGETLVRLFQHNGDRASLWMSNTYDEKLSQYFHPCTGNILIGGLGIGLVLEYIQVQVKNAHKVTKVVVVEKEQGVIDLVADTFKRKMKYLEIICGDIFEFGKTYQHKDFFDAAFIDVWGNVSEDDLSSMTKVKRSLRRVMKPGRGRIKCWAEGSLRYSRRTNNRTHVIY